MKTKQLVIIISILLVLIIAVFFITQWLKAGKKEVSKYEDYAEYISAFTSGYVSKNSDIVVEFNYAINLNKALDEKQLKNYFIIEPNVNGTIYWKNERTLAFRPEKPFEYNKQYYVTLKLKELLLEDFKLKDFVFSFSIIPQTITMDEYKVKTINDNDYTWQSVTTLIKLNDNEDLELLKSCFSVKLNNKQLSFKLLNLENTTYQLTIDSIKRTNNEQQLLITCQANKLGIDNTIEKFIKIPAISNFQLLDVFVNQYPEQTITMVFSDPIDTWQNLGGLITISPETPLRYSIDRNMVYLYPTELTIGDFNLNVFSGILNTKKQKLLINQPYSFPITFFDIKPQVKFADDGFIIPTHAQGSLIPILTMNLKELDIRIIQIYENNVLQFLQNNKYDESNELRRVGKIVYQGTISLNINNQDKNNWKRHNLDISKFIKADPGSMYRISLGFRQHQTLYDCNKAIKANDTDIENSFDYFDYSYYYEDYYYNEDDYESYWENVDNPCHKAYYGSRRCVSKNVYASDIALIAKKTPANQLYVFASDVKTAEPLAGVEVEIYNYPKQLLEKAVTDGDGKVIFNLKDEPSFVIAKKQNMRSYLKLSSELSLSMASFDVSGQSIINGLNGFIFGERGVWRPGDSLYFTFILQDNANNLPARQPIIFELLDPSRNIVKKQIFTKNESNVYVFRTATEPDALTGDYLLQVKIAKAVFTKTVKIETVKPNRLKISLKTLREPIIPSENTEITLHSEWLHGAMASGLKAQVDMMLVPQKTTFKGFDDYTFDDITKKYSPEQQTIFNNSLDEQGNAIIKPQFNIKDEAPGMMKAIFTTKVFEKGGEFSIDQTSFLYCPYNTFVGFRVKEDDKDYNILYTDKNHSVSIVAIDTKGKLETSAREVEIKLYKLDWRWWWDQTDEYFDLNYRGYSDVRIVETDTITVNNGKAQWNLRINKPNYGRFLLVVKDLESLHSSSRILYIDWSDWKRRVTTEHEQASTQLVFATDKDTYKVNEEVIVSFPGGSNGRALLSIENSKGVLHYEWIKTVSGINTYRFKASPDMSPNVYISITLLQAYNNTENDKPIRLYGIKNISIENPESKLFPVIQMPNELRSENTCQINISEKNGKEMFYTLAIVDEGLLALTRYKTPDPWNHFYAKVAYQFIQWDLYDYFIKGLTGKLMNIIGIGGDTYEEALDIVEAQKAKRFKPMVIFEGPIHLKPGKKQTHTIKLPNYMGEVRVMVVARYKNSYGSAEKQAKVIKPLVVMPSLPRILSVEDKIIMPVSVFAYDKNIKNATIMVKVSGPIMIDGKNQETIALPFQTEKNVFFNIKAGKTEGMAKIEVIAKSASEQSVSTIDIYVRNPNPFVTEAKGWVVEQGKSLSIDLKPKGVENTNFTTLEISAIPPLNLEKHLNYLISYPHGCIEQIVSGAFPQLYLSTLIDLNPSQLKEIEFNVKSVIQRLVKYQTSMGGFSYWPGNQNVEEWLTSYTGHFLIEAQKAGYNIPSSMISKWKKYQKQAAQQWYNKGPVSQYIQAYRLYTLALIGDAEINSMNRLASETTIADIAAYPLAAAYALTGRTKIANQLINKRALTFNQNLYYDIYGSEMREKSFVAMSYVAMSNKTQAFKYIKEISSMLSSNTWYSTQSLSFALIACANYLQGERLRSPMRIEYTINNKPKKQYESMKYFYSVKLDNANANNNMSIQNISSFPVYVQSISKGVLPIGTESSYENKIKLEFMYQNYTGMSVEWNKVTQTENLNAVIQVTNNSNETLNRLALTYTVPSGWEILNDRLNETSFTQNENFEYKDIRDDKVMYYFSLQPRETKKFIVPVNASFAGRFYHPMIICEDMYNYDTRAQIKGMWVEVQKSF
ncbi:MAG: MG2 domain-containing protein [Bacteroidales bacterium]|nr:MG2 domain-containing protein [Bacteroidales bacterium]